MIVAREDAIHVKYIMEGWVLEVFSIGGGLKIGCIPVLLKYKILYMVQMKIFWWCDLLVVFFLNNRVFVKKKVDSSVSFDYIE